VEAVSKNEEIVEGLKKKYEVSSLKEFEEKIVSGEVNRTIQGTSALRRLAPLERHRTQGWKKRAELGIHQRALLRVSKWFYGNPCFGF